MSIFDQRRLTNNQFKLDIEAIRRGVYSDRYFANIAFIFDQLRQVGYGFTGRSPRLLPFDVTGTPVGDISVEAQVFNRRAPFALIAGVDLALNMIRHAAGYYANERFIETWRDLDVVAVEDGTITEYGGRPDDVRTVIEIRGRYRDFTILETPILGVLTRASRIATNVYEVLKAANGKQVLFFPARFDVPEVQPLDGYAYWIAVQRFNLDTGHRISPLVSTEAQAAWWGGRGGGTIPHAMIACFFADTAEAMLAFARYMPVEVPRIVLADFENDTVGASLATLDAFWPLYQAALETGDHVEQQRWTLNAVRLDTSGNLRDISLSPTDEAGVSPALVTAVRQAINRAWERWNVPEHLADTASTYCKNVRIVVSGGFNREKIERFERENVPVDVYGVGSTFLTNDKTTNTDFTMDVVRVRVNDRWLDMAKVGRQPCDNPDLRPVDLGIF